MRFADDGGTRSWRANRATWGRVIESEPASVRARWRRLSLRQQLTLILFAGLLPFFILFGGLATLALWDAAIRYLT